MFSNYYPNRLKISIKPDSDVNIKRGLNIVIWKLLLRQKDPHGSIGASSHRRSSNLDILYKVAVIPSLFEPI